MTRAPRLALTLLLVLMQCFAPWVHAHTGVERGGFLHLPGLEFLAGQSGGCALSNARPGGTDLIVGVQAGKWDRADGLREAPASRVSPALLPIMVPLPSPPPRSGRLPTREIPACPFSQCRHDGCPRAPPSSFSPV